MCLVPCVWVFLLLKADKYSKSIIIIIIIFKERESSLMWSNQVGLIVFNIFIIYKSVIE